MAYVQPNSIVQLFKGINLDNRYMHTIYFANESAQNSWFNSKVTYTFQQISYTRYTRNSIKLKADTTDIMDCTYLRFKNDRSVDKWFYAFINSIEYVNENTCLITYEIDVMQTWFIQNGSIEPCYVLREHVNNDTFGLHLEHEPIGSDVYDCDRATATTTSSNLVIDDLFANAMAYVNTSGEPNDTSVPVLDPDTGIQVQPMINNNLVIGTKTFLIPLSNMAGFKSILDAIIGGNWDEKERKENVIDMCFLPTAFASYTVNANTHDITVLHSATFDGYRPKNKKLYGYPYSYLQLTTKDGSGSMYRWEYFYDIYNDDQYNVAFECYGNGIGGGTAHCYPKMYNGIADNLDAKVVINDFPKIPYSYDAYQAWVAAGGKTRLDNENKITNARGAIGIASAVSNAITKTVTGTNQIASGVQNGNANAVASGVNSIVQSGLNVGSSIVDFVEAKNKIKYEWLDANYEPNQVVGASTPNLTAGTHKLGFFFYNVHVRVSEMIKIDDFFSCYGYAINQVKQPNLTGRAYWNFIQTQDCVISGNMPASSKEAIARIFDGGITFWHNGDQIGNYRQSVSSGSINNPII